jgi:hypothetical protein
MTDVSTSLSSTWQDEKKCQRVDELLDMNVKIKVGRCRLTLSNPF